VTDDANQLRTLLRIWRDDHAGTHRSWFLWDERLKNFRSIRRGLQEVIREVEDGSFGNAYRGSSLETVVHSIAEQKQIFKGADHAFLWKPKLRIPDIYENPENQKAFGRFLNSCFCCDTEADVIRAIHALDSHSIKGLGPAVANLLYFLHPTIAPPFNTAIVRGYNALTGSKVKLGRWSEYLAMRNGILRLNAEHRDLLSNDLGAITGFLFDIGSGRYPAPPMLTDEAAKSQWFHDLELVREQARAQSAARTANTKDEASHTQVQAWLRDLGLALGFDVWIASNDRGREFEQQPLGTGCRTSLPARIEAIENADAIRLIDVLWIDRTSDDISAAFEVEHSTSIYSGIVRMLDLAFGAPAEVRGLFLVAPDNREEEVRAQLRRPAFASVAHLGVRFLPYGELAAHREAIARFGSGLKPLEAIARRLI